jgi:hypothetical protein
MASGRQREFFMVVERDRCRFIFRAKLILQRGSPQTQEESSRVLNEGQRSLKARQRALTCE